MRGRFLGLTVSFAFLMFGCAREGTDLSTPLPSARGIRNGTIAGQFSYPLVGALMSDEGQACTGTLLSPTCAITAGHCNDEKNANFTIPGTGTAKIKEFRVHPKEDLAIIKLDSALDPLAKTEATFPKIENVLPDTPPLKGSLLTFVGFGMTGIAKIDDDPKLLQKRFSTNNQVVGRWGNTNEIAVDSTTNAFTCAGDSGGPAYSSSGQIVGTLIGGPSVEFRVVCVAWQTAVFPDYGNSCSTIARKPVGYQNTAKENFRETYMVDGNKTKRLGNACMDLRTSQVGAKYVEFLSWHLANNPRLYPQGALSYEEAKSYCESLARDPADGPWRLPTEAEMKRIAGEFKPNTPDANGGADILVANALSDSTFRWRRKYFWTSEAATGDGRLAVELDTGASKRVPNAATVCDRSDPLTIEVNLSAYKLWLTTHMTQMGCFNGPTVVTPTVPTILPQIPKLSPTSF